MFDFTTPITKDTELEAVYNCKPPVPDVPSSLADIKLMLNAGKTIPVGTEIPDTYAGNSNPLIVAQNLDNSNNSSYGGAVGVILVRKYAIATTRGFGSTVDYITSVAKDFLDNAYPSNCSDGINSIAATISIPYYNGTSLVPINAKWFLMSSREVYGLAHNGVEEGAAFDYWKYKTGFASPSDDASAGRVVKTIDGTNKNWWLRTRAGDTRYEISVNQVGKVYSLDVPTNTFNILPACFIAKDN